MSTLTTRLLGASCAGALLIGCLAGCGSASASSDLITLAQARAVAQTWLHASDATQVSEERGSLQRIDEAMALVRTGPAPTPDPQVGEDTIWVAHQSRYPISFLCFDKPAASAGRAMAVEGQLFRFSKASASAPWTVTHQGVLLSLGSRPSLALDSSGYAQIVSPQDYGKFKVSPAQVGRDWGAYLQAANGSDAREFAPGPLTTQAIQDDKQQNDAGVAKHYNYSYAYAPTDDPVDAYLLRDGGALVLLGLQVTTHIVAQAAPIQVTQDGKGVSDPAPGWYHDVTYVALALALFTTPPKDSAVKVTGIGAYTGTVTATGTKA